MITALAALSGSYLTWQEVSIHALDIILTLGMAYMGYRFGKAACKQATPVVIDTHDKEGT